jgi:CelD/BcsL family acetyltransferase involved in cellulose biosynthesis
MALAYRVVSPADLDPSLLDAWRSVQADSVAFHSPCFSPEFTQAVANVRSDVHVAVIEDNGKPAGFFPYQRSFAGIGKPVAGPLSDFHGVVARSDCRWALPALMRATNLSTWSFDHLVGDASPFEGCITARAPSPQISLKDGYESFVRLNRESGSSYIPKTEGLARKLGREVGPLNFMLHDPDPAVLDQLFRWKSEQYSRSGLGDVFAVPWTGDLLKRISQIQTAEFSGVCSVLRAGERIVSVHMGMRSRDVMHYWFPAYDPEFAKFSVGIILLLRMAESLAGTGVHTIDLGKGEDPYKQRLMTGSVELHEGVAERPSFASMARNARRGLETWVRRSPFIGIARLPGRWLVKLERRGRFR